MSFEAILNDITSGIPGCMATGLVDIPTGTFLSSRTTTRSYKEEFELLAAGTSAVFDAAPTAAMDGILGAVAEDTPEPLFKEVTLIGKGRVYLYCRFSANSDLALIVVCRAGANIGMILAKAHLQLASIEAQVS